MAIPEERRNDQLRAMEPGVGERGRHLADTQAARYLDRLLKHFEDTDQEWIAEAIRNGGEEVREMTLGHWHGTGTYRIHEPETE
jgi:hypothetical protein